MLNQSCLLDINKWAENFGKIPEGSIIFIFLSLVILIPKSSGI
jgi:hypothetical protein